MNKFFLVVVIMLLAFDTKQAQKQNQKFQVDYNEIKGELTQKDSYKKDFGRYDGFKIELFEGEAVNFVAYSTSFQPSIALVNPKGEIFKQSDPNDKGYANIVSIIPSSGNWVLYVIGDEKAAGSYIIQNAIAEPNSISLNNPANMCITLEFLLAHANAYFFLLESPLLSKQSLIKLNDAVDSFIEEDGSYHSIFYDGNDYQKAETVFNNITEQIKSCVGNDWQLESTKWEKIEKVKTKSVGFNEKINDKKRFITISFYDFSGSGQQFGNKYNIDVEINKRK